MFHFIKHNFFHTFLFALNSPHFLFQITCLMICKMAELDLFYHIVFCSCCSKYSVFSRELCPKTGRFFVLSVNHNSFCNKTELP